VDCSVAVALASVRARADDKAKSGDAVRPPQSFELDEATISDLQTGMASGKYTAQSLTQKYLDRIAEIDKNGPGINSVIETNPEALAIAAALDNERKTGRVRGRLHGFRCSSKTISILTIG
jgi:amidase